MEHYLKTGEPEREWSCSSILLAAGAGQPSTRSPPPVTTAQPTSSSVQHNLFSSLLARWRHLLSATGDGHGPPRRRWQQEGGGPPSSADERRRDDYAAARSIPVAGMAPLTADGISSSWPLYSSPIFSPPHWYHMNMMTMMGLDVAGDGNLTEYQGGEPMMWAASLSVRSSPQAPSLQHGSPTMLLDKQWNFDDRQLSSPEELGPVPSEASHVPAALLATQGTSSGGTPGTTCVRYEEINRKCRFHLFFSDASRPFMERLTQAFTYFNESIGQQLLNQVCAPVKKEVRYVPTATGQPLHCIGFLSFTTSTTIYMFFLDLVTPRSVYRQELPEWNPNVRMQHDIRHEVYGDLPCMSNTPMFELHVQSRFELFQHKWTSNIKYDGGIYKICAELEAVDLRSMPPSHFPMLNDNRRQTVLLEIKEILTVISENYELPLAQTWALCNGCLYANELAFHVAHPHMRGFRDACVQQHLQVGQGVPGKASLFRQPCYVKDIGLFCILEYPLVQYARLFGLVGSVAVCAQSSYTGVDDYILEFFLPCDCREDDEQMVLLESISALMEQMDSSLKIVGDADLTKLSSHHLPTNVNEEQNITSAERLRECRANKVKHVEQTSVPLINCCSSAEVDNAADKCSSMLGASATTLLGIENPSQPQHNATKALSPLSSRKKIVKISNVKSHHHVSNESGSVNEVTELGHNDVEADEPADNAPKKRRRSQGHESKEQKEAQKCKADGARRSSCKSRVWSHFPNVEKNADSRVTKAKCTYCGKWLEADSKRNGTSRLQRHITDYHKMDLDASPETNKKLSALAIKTNNQSKDQSAPKLGGIVPDKVPNEVIILDSQHSVGKISRLEGQLLDKINSVSDEEILVDEIHEVPHEEDDDTTIERDEYVLQRSGPRRPTTSSRNTQGKEERRLKISARIEESMERLFKQTREEESTRLAKQAEEESARLAKQAEEESARLAREKEAAESNDFSIRRCISVLNTLEVTKEEKAKAYAIFIRSKENREAFICGCEADVESTLIWLRNEMV